MLVEERIDVGSEPRTVQDWSAREKLDGCLGADEPTLSKRRQLADRNAVAGDDERLAAIERAHDLAALVPKLSLADLPRHIRSVALVLQGMCYSMCVMERVGVRELRQNLSVYLRRVKLGERLEVTERGEVVARLEPIVADDDPIARLERAGRILRRSTGDLSKIRPLQLGLERPLSTILEEMREDTA
jgi:prevent-host-death family protein